MLAGEGMSPSRLVMAMVTPGTKPNDIERFGVVLVMGVHVLADAAKRAWSFGQFAVAERVVDGVVRPIAVRMLFVPRMNYSSHMGFPLRCFCTPAIIGLHSRVLARAPLDPRLPALFAWPHMPATYDIELIQRLAFSAFGAGLFH